MTNLWKYKEILLDLMLDLYGDTEDERVRQGIYEAREIVYKSQPTIKWLKEREQCNYRSNNNGIDYFG